MEFAYIHGPLSMALCKVCLLFGSLLIVKSVADVSIVYSESRVEVGL